ncbi:MAG: hypothetical protein HZB50_14470 [Chloroflexi bacterium]|nr:hypothetical protein [Chloroflexota bacterium]
MDAPFREQKSGTQQPGRVLAGLQILIGLLNKMVGFFQLTEEEQREAGVYHGD